MMTGAVGVTQTVILDTCGVCGKEHQIPDLHFRAIDRKQVVTQTPGDKEGHRDRSPHNIPRDALA